MGYMGIWVKQDSLQLDITVVDFLFYFMCYLKKKNTIL